MKKIASFFGVLILIALACYFRFYKLGSAPNTMIVDEAHYAYLSYSILETGKDEHGVAYPIVFKGFGDYKLPAQVYSLVPFVKVFGLNNFAARLPSAVSGFLLIFVIYFLFKEWGFSKKAAALAGLITFISPWTFILSRFAYEANLGLLFFALAILFIFKAKKRSQLIFFILSALFFALTIYSYVIYKFIAVFFVIFFALYFFFFTKKNKWQAVSFVSVFFILITPFLFGLAANSNLARFKQIGIFSDTQLISQIDENRDFCLKEYPKVLCYTFFNKGVTYSKEFVNALVKTYSPEYLFIKGDSELTYMNVTGTGLFNLFLLPLYVLGLLIFLLRFISKKDSRSLLNTFLLLGLLVVPLPGVLAGVQKVRISALFIFILPLFVFAYQFLTEKIKKNFLLDFVLAVLAMASFVIYFVNFISVHSIKKDFYYDSFVKGIFEFTEDYMKNNQVDEIVIQDFFSDPIMYYAYYQQVDPSFYQKEVVLDNLENSGFQHAIALGKYRVADNEEPNTLACQAFAAAKKVVYVDNHWNSKAHILNVVKSNFGVLDYAFIIDLSSFGEELNKAGQCK